MSDSIMAIFMMGAMVGTLIGGIIIGVLDGRTKTINKTIRDRCDSDRPDYSNLMGECDGMADGDSDKYKMVLETLQLGACRTEKEAIDYAIESITVREIVEYFFKERGQTE